MATAATLTSGAPTVDLDSVTGSIMVLGMTGGFGGGQVLVEASLPTTPTVFAKVKNLVPGDPEAIPSGADFWELRIPGTKVRLTLKNADTKGTSSINAEIVAAT